MPLPKEIASVLSKDEFMVGLIKDLDPDKLVPSGNVFHDLMSCIIEQQIHYRSTKKTFSRLLDKAGLTELHPDNFEVFEKNALGSIKLSMRKFESIQDIADSLSSWDLDWSTINETAIRKELSSLKGVENWSIEMLLIYTFQHPDIFPTDDYHLKKAMQAAYQLGDLGPVALKKEMLSIASQWSPYRSYAFRYLIEWKKLGANR